MCILFQNLLHNRSLISHTRTKCWWVFVNKYNHESNAKANWQKHGKQPFQTFTYTLRCFGSSCGLRHRDVRILIMVELRLARAEQHWRGSATVTIRVWRTPARDQQQHGSDRAEDASVRYYFRSPVFLKACQTEWLKCGARVKLSRRVWVSFFWDLDAFLRIIMNDIKVAVLGSEGVGKSGIFIIHIYI